MQHPGPARYREVDRLAVAVYSDKGELSLGDLDEFAGPHAGQVADGYRRTDLEILRVRHRGDHGASFDVFARSLQLLCDDTREGGRYHAAAQAGLGLPDRDACDAQFAGGQVAACYRAFAFDFRDDARVPQSFVSFDLARQRLVIDARTVGLGDLALALQVEHFAIEACDGLAGIEQISRFRDPFEPPGNTRSNLRLVTAEHGAGGGYAGCHLCRFDFGHRHGNCISLRTCIGSREYGQESDGQGTECERDLSFHVVILAPGTSARRSAISCLASPSRRILGSRRRVNTALTLMPPTMTVASPR